MDIIMKDYIAVIKANGSFGEVTWSVFDDKADLTQYMNSKMTDGSDRILNSAFTIVAEGVSEKEAIMISGLGHTQITRMIERHKKNPDEMGVHF